MIRPAHLNEPQSCISFK